jgi:hypothetical protein
VAEWFQLACTRSIVRRACRYAIGVGTLLILINHGDAILRRELSLTRVLRIALTVTVPYVVSTASSVSAMREKRPASQETAI